MATILSSEISILEYIIYLYVHSPCAYLRASIRHTWLYRHGSHGRRSRLSPINTFLHKQELLFSLEQAPEANHSGAGTIVASLPALQADIWATEKSRHSPLFDPVSGSIKLPPRVQPNRSTEEKPHFREPTMSSPSVPVTSPYWSYLSWHDGYSPMKSMKTSGRICGVVAPQRFPRWIK